MNITPTTTRQDKASSSPYKGVTFSYSGGPICSNQAVKDRVKSGLRQTIGTQYPLVDVYHLMSSMWLLM